MQKQKSMQQKQDHKLCRKIYLSHIAAPILTIQGNWQNFSEMNLDMIIFSLMQHQ